MGLLCFCATFQSVLIIRILPLSLRCAALKVWEITKFTLPTKFMNFNSCGELRVHKNYLYHPAV